MFVWAKGGDNETAGFRLADWDDDYSCAWCKSARFTDRAQRAKGSRDRARRLAGGLWPLVPRRPHFDAVPGPPGGAGLRRRGRTSSSSSASPDAATNQDAPAGRPTSCRLPVRRPVSPWARGRREPPPGAVKTTPLVVLLVRPVPARHPPRPARRKRDGRGLHDDRAHARSASSSSTRLVPATSRVMFLHDPLKPLPTRSS